MEKQQEKESNPSVALYYKPKELQQIGELLARLSAFMLLCSKKPTQEIKGEKIGTIKAKAKKNKSKPKKSASPKLSKRFGVVR